MYEVVGTLMSRTFRVFWMLEELGQPYTQSPEPPRSPRVQEPNPLGKVPILIDNGTPIADSTAIITYLADKHGALTFPAGTLERAAQDSFTHQILDEIDAALWTASRHSFILPEDMRVPDIKPSLKKEYARSIAKLMARKRGPFLMGDQITIPDIILTHCGGWAMTAKFPTDNDDFKSYLKQLRARPAFQKARENK